MRSTSASKSPFASFLPSFRKDSRNSRTRSSLPLPQDTDNEQDFVAKYILHRTLRACKRRDDVYDALITLAPLLFKGSSGELAFPIVAAQAKGNLIIGWGTTPQHSNLVTYQEPIVAAGVQIGTLQLWETANNNGQKGASAIFVAKIARTIGTRITQLHGC